MISAPRLTEVTRVRLHVPFRERVAEWNALLVSSFGLIDVYRVATEDPDVVGWGEQLHVETTGMAGRPPLAALRGANPAELLTETNLGLGLQTALYDVVGKTLGVPLHRLFGRPLVRDRVPLAWWNTKMPPEVLAAEARAAVAAGYLAHKIKARPFFDVYEQVAQVAAATPANYRLDLDWNQMLLTAAAALPVLTELAAQTRVAIFETPIRQRDLEGYRRLRDKLDRPVVEHFLETPFPMAIAAEAFDGFVCVGFDIAGLLRQGTLAAEFGKPIWVQQVGAGLATALVAHLAAVLESAYWPSVTALNTYADDLLTTPLRVAGGTVAVPAGPGLGVEVDEAALAKYAVADDYVPVERRHLLTVELPGREPRHYETMAALWQDCLRGNLPAQERGARLTVRQEGS